MIIMKYNPVRWILLESDFERVVKIIFEVNGER